MRTPRDPIEEDGFELVPAVLDANECAVWISELGPVSGAGARGVLGRPAVARLARAESILALVRPHLPMSPRPVRGIYFDKAPGSNWLVAWHQDLTIALRERREVPGFGPWSAKGGVPHVQPPDALLERMLTVRLHLDEADERNGALRVLPGSHRCGRLDEDRIRELRATGSERLCAAKAGDALLMRPLLLHASGRSRGTGHRRVLHLEYAGFDLPDGLEWSEPWHGHPAHAVDGEDTEQRTGAAG